MKTDQYYMNLALELAASAKGKTNPNPLVGAVIVKNGMIVGSGLHRKAGEPHAEVHAFRMAGDHAKDGTLYVTLEPCSHYGKTPPCAELVKNSGVKRVVIAMEDPNPLVAGRGIRLLKEAGIEVEVGVLEKEARLLNERFIHNMIFKRPFIISKVAMTLDGKLATYNGHSKWITGSEARETVHRLRDQVDGIMVGIGTILTDNPELTTRLPEGGKSPIRIILDTKLRTPLDAKVTKVTDEAKTLIVVGENVDKEKVKVMTELGVEIITASVNEFGFDLTCVLQKLYEKGITDILLEGGSELNGAFLKGNFIDKYIVYIAPKVLGGHRSKTPFAGLDAESMSEAINLDFDSIQQIGRDICITAYPVKKEF
ncbi:bifunctional diaminohydroxyphosphoribosylaminopyrimidine deaminase/5-amino-6-(5-phosphoribosylamino)uracil reductase RibD [Bacillus marasmi]|uniref:bifunctional diaminohydroxyphosphoribosylaminopyrimidine deaminase/5-amino-6-(5-phosphoribosylamino)uracil reductase RibD n=1 Tax=Bacillus marasmi TaxID=1926279 RepID=UPI0011CC6D99|nr:bifunctional diaminohydroxyphosphoribosylaminopyrimidine deaminase/5-amino-6-(5-phosphoribosylamino)uracil reductase RibD [Bacillus marasmi]